MISLQPVYSGNIAFKKNVTAPEKREKKSFVQGKEGKIAIALAGTALAVSCINIAPKLYSAIKYLQFSKLVKNPKNTINLEDFSKKVKDLQIPNIIKKPKKPFNSEVFINNLKNLI